MIRPYAAANSRVTYGGVAIIAMYGPLVGGVIANPSSSVDQGLSAAEPLYVDFITTATLGGSGTTITLGPGESVTVPVNQTTSVSVNAASAGHRFSAVVFQPLPPYPPTPIPGIFPPVGPTSITAMLPAYLYEQYDDDENLQEFVDETNSLQQTYVDWFNNVGLPIYTGLSDNLLDWIGANLYGIIRPSLSSQKLADVGPYNTYVLNGVPFNYFKASVVPPFFKTDDDTYKRIITWAFYKGDGKIFSIPWLKRRIKRFLIGVNGVGSNVDETYDVSVTFGVGRQINIHVATYAPLLKEAINSGVLEMPYQFNFVVTTP